MASGAGQALGQVTRGPPLRTIYGYAYTVLRMVSVGVLGASGYGGGELLRLLQNHPHLSVSTVWGHSAAGRDLSSVQPHLVGYPDLVLDEFAPAAAADLDVLFAALPHGQSGGLLAQVPERVAIVDLGADYRLRSAAQWATYYGGEHAGVWPYGLPELPGQRDLLAGHRRIANPGCYATAVALAYAPLLDAGLISRSDLVVVAASGTSGAGRTPSLGLLAAEVTSGVRAYKVGGVHQHIPEMEQSLGGVTLGFTPLLAPMARGILATCTAPGRAATTERVREAFTRTYGGEPFVRVLPEGQWPSTQMTLGGNSAAVQAAFDEHSGRVVVCVAIDNLVKGAAGQAMQNANRIFGWPETTGLPRDGMAP